MAVVPEKMNKAAVSKVGATLVARKLMRETRSKSGMPVWREDDDGSCVRRPEFLWHSLVTSANKGHISKRSNLRFAFQASASSWL
jgi:hypothetical protein